MVVTNSAPSETQIAQGVLQMDEEIIVEKTAVTFVNEDRCT